MADREEIRVPELGTPISHYTDAVRVGDLLFVSGCVPTDAEGNVVGGDDVAAQARKTLENIGVILERAGASFADVAKVTVFLTDIDDRPKINPGATGDLRRRSAREHADRGEPARDPRDQDRDRGRRADSLMPGRRRSELRRATPSGGYGVAVSVRVVVLLGLAGLLLAACGGSKSEQAAPPATTQTTQTTPRTAVTPATAGLTIDDPGPGDALRAFIEAAGAGDTDALWGLLTPVSRKQLGPTRADFARKYGQGFRDGVGTFAGTPYEMVISRRDDGGWGVAAIAGQPRSRRPGGVRGLRRRRPAGRQPVAPRARCAARAEAARPTPLRAPSRSRCPPATRSRPPGSGSTVRRCRRTSAGRRAHFVVAGRLPGEPAADAVVVAFARTGAAASAGAFPLSPKTEPGTDTGADADADADADASAFSA